MKHAVKLAPFIFLAATISGCATNGDLNALRAEVRQATETADIALNTANAAKAEAQNANEAAQAALAASADIEGRIESIRKQTPKRK